MAEELLSNGLAFVCSASCSLMVELSQRRVRRWHRPEAAAGCMGTRQGRGGGSACSNSYMHANVCLHEAGLKFFTCYWCTAKANITCLMLVKLSVCMWIGPDSLSDTSSLQDYLTLSTSSGYGSAVRLRCRTDDGLTLLKLIRISDIYLFFFCIVSSSGDTSKV